MTRESLPTGRNFAVSTADRAAYAYAMSTAVVVVGIVMVGLAAITAIGWRVRRSATSKRTPQDEYRHNASRVRRAASGLTAFGVWSYGSGKGGNSYHYHGPTSGGGGCGGGGCGGG